MFTAIIVDDEELGAETLNIMVQKYCPEIKILGIANDVQDAIEMIYDLNPNILFLDIDLPSGTGFDILSKTSNISKEVIFTTAHSEHAIKAIKENACDYLLKPILVSDLVDAFSKLKKKFDDKVQSTTNLIEKKIPISSTDGINFYDASEIIRAEASSNYTIVFLNDGRQIISSKTLKIIESQLPSYFIRIHSSHVVNTNYITKYLKGDGGFIKLNDDKLIPVSRSFKEILLKRLL